MRSLQLIRAFWTTARGVVGGLPPPKPGDNPLDLFRAWFAEASRAGLPLPESMTLATSSDGGAPSARIVLLKEVDERGFVFFTNYESQKAQDLDSNPRAALVFHWNLLQRQVRIEGAVERVSHAESEAYFHSRARGSQIGAWASRQSRPLESRSDLVERVRATEERFSGEDVPLPDFWGGYRVIPVKIEFWQGRLYRLHDRVQFERDGAAWTANLLDP